MYCTRKRVQVEKPVLDLHYRSQKNKQTNKQTNKTQTQASKRMNKQTNKQTNRKVLGGWRFLRKGGPKFTKIRRP